MVNILKMETVLTIGGVDGINNGEQKVFNEP